MFAGAFEKCGENPALKREFSVLRSTCFNLFTIKTLIKR
jgi:hypothetical protein